MPPNRSRGESWRTRTSTRCVARTECALPRLHWLAGDLGHYHGPGLAHGDDWEELQPDTGGDWRRTSLSVDSHNGQPSGWTIAIHGGRDLRNAAAGSRQCEFYGNGDR